jgi:hypothetical protein
MRKTGLACFRFCFASSEQERGLIPWLFRSHAHKKCPDALRAATHISASRRYVTRAPLLLRFRWKVGELFIVRQTAGRVIIVIFALSQPVTCITLRQGDPGVGQIKLAGSWVVTYIHKETKVLMPGQKWPSADSLCKSKRKAVLLSPCRRKEERRCSCYSF